MSILIFIAMIAAAAFFTKMVSKRKKAGIKGWVKSQCVLFLNNLRSNA